MKAVHFRGITEAVRYLEGNPNEGIVLFSDYEKIQQLSEVVGDHVILCSDAGEFTKEGYREGEISGFTYDKSIAEIIELTQTPIKNIHALQNGYQKVKNNKNAFLFLLCDGLQGVEERIMTTLYFIKDEFKIIGGSAGDSVQFKETFIYIGKKRVNSVGIFFDSQTRTQILKQNIYQTRGKKLLVTEADAIKRTVKCFNDQPASVAYAKAIEVKESELSHYFMKNPLGRICEDGIYISSPMQINGDQSITFYSQIMPNTFVEILEPIPLEECFTKMKECIEVKPKFVLSINCILRSLQFKADGKWKDVGRELLSISNNQAGFVSYGEQFYKKHLNQTMVLLLVE